VQQATGGYPQTRPRSVSLSTTGGASLTRPAVALFHTVIVKGVDMEIMVFIILLGVALIDGKLWKITLEQNRHNRAVEVLLKEIRDRSGSTNSTA